MKRTMKKNRLNFNKKRIFLTAVYIALAFIFLQVTFYIPDKHRYYRQFTTVLSIAFFIITVISFSKLFTREIRFELYQRISQMFLNVSDKFRKLTDKIKKKLGIKERVLLRGKDEKSFIFNYDDGKSKNLFFNKKNNLHWRDMKTNAEKIRYLYIKYILFKIKKGYAFKFNTTPNEISRELRLDDEAGELFAVYYDARYSGGRINIPNEIVDRQEKFIKTFGKL